jgi:hypothetical protein
MSLVRSLHHLHDVVAVYPFLGSELVVAIVLVSSPLVCATLSFCSPLLAG